MKVKTGILTLVLMICGGTWLSAQDGPNRFTLQKAIDYALENSTAIREAQINIADAEQQIVEQRAFGIPQINGNVGYSYYAIVPQQPLPEAFRDALEQIVPPGEEVPDNAAFFLRNNFNAGLRMDAMVFDPSYFVGLKAARQFKSLVGREYQVARRDVHKAVVEAYLPVLLINQSLEVLDSNIAVLEDLLAETRALYEAGFSEQLDVDRQVLSLNNTRTTRDNFEGRKESALRRLKYTMGYPVDKPLVVDQTLDDLLEYASDQDLNAPVNPMSRPDYQLVQESLEINDLRVKLNRSGYWPSMSAFGTLEQAYQGNTFQDGFWAPASQLGVQLSIPIFDGLEKSAKVQRARLQKEQVEVRERDLYRAIHLEIGVARNNYNTAFETLERERANLDLAERIFETTQIKYREGVGSSVEVTQAEQSLYTAQQNYVQALYDLVLAKQNLDIALRW